MTQAQRDVLCTPRVPGKLRATRLADSTMPGHAHPLCAQHPEPHVSVSASQGKEYFVSFQWLASVLVELTQGEIPWAGPAQLPEPDSESKVLCWPAEARMTLPA